MEVLSVYVVEEIKKNPSSTHDTVITVAAAVLVAVVVLAILIYTRSKNTKLTDAQAAQRVSVLPTFRSNQVRPDHSVDNEAIKHAE